VGLEKSDLVGRQTDSTLRTLSACVNGEVGALVGLNVLEIISPIDFAGERIDILKLERVVFKDILDDAIIAGR
jgi:hypothetical protein